MNFIGELYQFFKLIDKEALNGKIDLGKRRVKSLSSYSSNSIYYFPMMVSDQCTLEEVIMAQKMCERVYAAFVVSAINLIPFHRISQTDRGSIEDYLKTFHQNMGISEPMNIGIGPLGESVSKVMRFTMDTRSVNDIYNESVLTPNMKAVLDIKKATAMREAAIEVSGAARQSNEIDGSMSKDPIQANKLSDRSVFVPSDQKKANELVPTYTKASVGFIIEETEQVITRDVLIGIKTFVHRITTAELIQNIYNTVINKRKFLKFVKWVSGEGESLADLLLSYKEIKNDVQNQSKGNSEWWNALKRRKRLADMSIPFIMNNYCPNMTLVMTMNEANFLKSEHGIDLFQDGHAQMFIKEYFMLGFVILDQSNSVAYVAYDSHNYQFQEYPYQTLERESDNNDRTMRELLKTFSTR